MVSPGQAKIHEVPPEGTKWLPDKPCGLGKLCVLACDPGILTQTVVDSGPERRQDPREAQLFL